MYSIEKKSPARPLRWPLGALCVAVAGSMLAASAPAQAAGSPVAVYAGAKPDAATTEFLRSQMGV